MDGSVPTAAEDSMHQTRVMQAYDAAAALLSVGPRDGLRDGARLAKEDPVTQHHRATVNFCKSCIWDAVVRSACTPSDGFRVIEVACGRGQDVPKLHHALRNSGKTCAAVVCMDISPGCVEAARGMVHKLLPAACAAASRFIVGDAGAASAPWHDSHHDGPDGPDGPAHIVSCHLALHYWCDSVERVRAFFKHAAAASAADASLVLSFADGRWVVRAARDALAAHQSRHGVTPDTVTVHAGGARNTTDPPLFTLEVPTALLGPHSPGPWGTRYEFQMGGGARVAAPECLVHEGALLREAATAGWAHVAMSARMDEAAALFAACSRYAAFGHAMHAVPLRGDALRTAAMYRVVILTKTTAAHAAAVASLFRPPPL